MAVTIEPSSFTMVDFDAEVIADLVKELAGSVGLDDHDIHIEVDETTPLARHQLVSIDPIHVRVESGALEDPKRIRQLSLLVATDVLGRHLLRARDRLDDGFGDPPDDDELSKAHRVAWEVHAVGQLDRAGHPTNQQRWRYTFRNRHGFTDAADEVFDVLWSGGADSWARITELSDEAAAGNPGRLDRKPA